MQIIQIADFHIDADADISIIKNKIDKLYSSLEISLIKEEYIVACLLGDIVDKGNASSYSLSKEVITYFSNKFSEFNFDIICVPGNHDLCNCPFLPDKPKECLEKKCSLDSFNSFCKDIGAKSCQSDPLDIFEYADLDIIVANSVFHRNCNYGYIDSDAIKDTEIKKPTLIVTHHTFLSENENDISAIRNAYKIFNLIEDRPIIGILHGHTHGYKDIVIGEKCRIVGVGPFLKQVPDVCNQVNLVYIDKKGISKIVNHYFLGDFDEYKSNVVFVRKDVGIYRGKNVSGMYSNIVNDTIQYGLIQNLVLNITSSFDSFNKQIEDFFPNHIDIAKDWQNQDVPDNLYYNHGSYMFHDDVNAIDFVVNELKSKSTSSRAIIPLIKFEDVLKSGDDFLPSFCVVQFGFNNELKKELFITLYLRALEVNNFLKINLCEIYVMCKRIQDKIRSIKDIDVTIHAFRAQYKENFGCFAKARIDTISESKILRLLETNKIDELIDMLREKINFNETVVRDHGINSLYNALITLNEENRLRKDIMDSVINAKNAMESLKQERTKTSNYPQIDMLEYMVHEEFEKLIELLNQGVMHDA